MLIGEKRFPFRCDICVEILFFIWKTNSILVENLDSKDDVSEFDDEPESEIKRLRLLREVGIWNIRRSVQGKRLSFNSLMSRNILGVIDYGGDPYFLF